jgi:ferric-dicitrate binding protein FerR (iron transport regulator)
MHEDLEAALREALRPTAPRPDFGARVMARVMPVRRRRTDRTWWLAAGLAAAVLIGVGVQHHMRQQREIQAGLEARREVIEALRVTNQKFDLALQGVRDASSPDLGAPGA